MIILTRCKIASFNPLKLYKHWISVITSFWSLKRFFQLMGYNRSDFSVMTFVFPYCLCLLFWSKNKERIFSTFCHTAQHLTISYNFKFLVDFHHFPIDSSESFILQNKIQTIVASWFHNACYTDWIKMHLIVDFVRFCGVYEIYQKN